MARASLRWLVLPLAGLLAVGIAWSEYRALRAIDLDDPFSSRGAVQAWLPWGGWAGLRLAGTMESFWRLDPAAAEDVLSWQLLR